MATYEQGDHVKVEFPDETTGIGERIWILVESCDEQKRLVFGRLDNEPLNDYGKNVKLGSQVAVSYARVREHRRAADFRLNNGRAIE
jgi:hypothetical protein